MRPQCLLLWAAGLAAAAACVGAAGETLANSEDAPGEGYCDARHSELCKSKGVHVACLYPVEGPSSTCEGYTPLPMTRDLRLFITHYINRRRQRLAEGRERGRGGAKFAPPQVMMLVEWDKELAYLAQRLADQCRFSHDQCRATLRYPYAGQTVGEVRWRGAAGRAVRRVLDAWWGERSNASPRDLTSPFRVTSRMSWGHFSQMAVWSLRAVGCGASLHRDADVDAAGAPTLLLVCDYSHNNMLGEATVRRGARAPCPAHTARRHRSPYPLLCVTLSPLDEERAVWSEPATVAFRQRISGWDGEWGNASALSRRLSEARSEMPPLDSRTEAPASDEESEATHEGVRVNGTTSEEVETALRHRSRHRSHDTADPPGSSHLLHRPRLPHRSRHLQKRPSHRVSTKKAPLFKDETEEQIFRDTGFRRQARGPG